MKIAFTLLSLSIVVLTGCASSHSAKTSAKSGPAAPAKDNPETVLVTYHVRPGMEAVFEHLLDTAWAAYRKEHLVKSEPHVLVREGEGNGTSGYIEIFTWVNHAAPGKASSEVQQLWAQEHSLCEARNGAQPLGGGEVELLLPK